ncbi:MAG: hypothetical protein DRO99_01025 [Candidatus Aenigmatarchaeota archaeon]|nr:MAG: hypothetical protein DRO99_01025 [Candidatus Aenigmarchaeota archaeon]
MPNSLPNLNPSPEEIAKQLSQIEEALRFAKIQQAREDIVAFAEYVMRDEQGRPWKVPEHQKEWFQLLLNPSIDRLLIIAPRLHGKTQTIVCFLLYMIGKNPNISIKYVCGDDELAIDIFLQIKRNILENPHYREVFPHIELDEEAEETKHKLTVKRDAALGIKDPTLQAFSVTASGTGRRAHIIIFDDIIGARFATQPRMIPKIQYIVENDWMNTLYENGRAIMIGTYWSWDPPDIYVEYAQNERWYKWEKPAIIYDEDGNPRPLWPERWSLEKLEQKRKESPVAFAQQFMLQGMLRKTDYFSEENIEKCIRTDIALGEGWEESWPVYIGVDPAASLGKEGSYSVIFVIAVSPQGVRVPVEIVRDKMGPEELARRIVALWRRYKPQLVLVENNSYQAALVDLIRVIAQNEPITVKGQFTGSQKWSPDEGLPRLHAEMANRMWIIPRKQCLHHADDPTCVVCQWLKEMREFPYGQTSDIIMAMWLADTAATTSMTFGEVPIVAAKRRRRL